MQIMLAYINEVDGKTTKYLIVLKGTKFMGSDKAGLKRCS